MFSINGTVHVTGVQLIVFRKMAQEIGITEEELKKLLYQIWKERHILPIPAS